MNTHGVGVTVGKFNPPHLGHLHLITSAAARVDDLFVIVGDHPDQTISAADRARWLETDSPSNVTVIVTPDDIPTANEPWAQRIFELLPKRPDVAFTSEEWGPGWAEAMGATHVSVNLHRQTYPISATQLRADLRVNFDWLATAARVDLAHRVVVAGAESTGKTTLTRAIANYFGTVWVPEYGRQYWEGRRHLTDQTWRSDEFAHIARTHHRMADDLARRASHGLVVLDTDVLVTNVWHRRYLGETSPDLTGLAGQHRPDLYLVAAPDFDWVQDGTRESQDHRDAVHQLTLDLVAASGAPHEVLTGTHEERMTQAVAAVESVVSYEVLR